jgi:hypothetical protein
MFGGHVVSQILSAVHSRPEAFSSLKLSLSSIQYTFLIFFGAISTYFKLSIVRLDSSTSYMLQRSFFFRCYALVFVFHLDDTIELCRH